MNQHRQVPPRAQVQQASEAVSEALEGFFGSHEVVATSLLAIALKINNLDVPDHLKGILLDMADDLAPEEDEDPPAQPEAEA